MPVHDGGLLTRMHRFYERFAGPDASIGALPLALLRSFFGDRMRVRVHGRPFTVDLRDTFISFKILSPLGYDRPETDVLRRLVRPADRVVDVGAHIGYFTVLFNGLAGRDGRILAIEPDTENVAVLRSNAATALFPDTIVTLEAAAGATPGRGELFRAPGNRGDHRMFEATEESRRFRLAPRERRTVDVTTVDESVREWDRVDLVKIDVQGYEPEVLRGMRATLARNLDIVLVVEYSPYLLRHASSDPSDLLSRLLEDGFGLWEITSRRTLVPVDPDLLTARLIGKSQVDLVCARGNAAARRIEPLVGRD